MSFTEKIDVLELLIELLHEHEKKLDSITDQLEIVHQTISQTSIYNPISDYEGTLLEDKKYRQILVVDDDENLAQTFKLILESEGFKVNTAQTGLSALVLMKKNRYDLVILDINLPDMLGYQLAEEINTLNRLTECIYITGYQTLKDDLISQQENINILIKPITPTKLVETSTQYLKKKSKNRLVRDV